MNSLEVMNLYEQQDQSFTTKFLSNTKSDIHIKTDFEKVELDTEWIDIIEETIPHLDAIYRNPNRFIINEEEIVKIEQAKRVTVDSIKHLAKHTNFIQEIEDDDVKPSKILNINKEETFDTYENKLIYTLIQNTQNFIDRRKKALLQKMALQSKDDKQISYNGHSVVGGESVGIAIEITSKKVGDSKNNNNEILKRIERIEQNIVDLMSTEVYKILAKLHVSLIRPPIKKTNVILKNVNFQYAMNLWDYIAQNINSSDEPKKQKRDYMDKGELKKFIDESFLLDYLTLCTLNEENVQQVGSKEKALANLLDRIVNMNPDLSKQELQDMLGVAFDKAKARRVASKADIERIFRKYIDKFFDKQLQTI
jgi:hypothetical protein